jgi:hypothetical protein
VRGSPFAGARRSRGASRDDRYAVLRRSNHDVLAGGTTFRSGSRTGRVLHSSPVRSATPRPLRRVVGQTFHLCRTLHIRIAEGRRRHRPMDKDMDSLIGFLAFLPDAMRNADDRLFAAIWLGILGWFWFNILRTPYEARISPDGSVRFRGLARTVVVAAADIREIRGLSGGYGMMIGHASGRLWLRMGFTENFQFLTRIRQLNPSVRFRGI